MASDRKPESASPMREKIEVLAKGRGLRRNDLAHALGPGLRRLWEIDVNDSAKKVFERVCYEFEKVFAKLEKTDGHPVERVQLSARVRYNTASVEEIWDQDLGKREEWLNDKPRREGGVPFSSQRRFTRNQLYPLLEQSFLAEWEKKFPGEPFPGEQEVPVAPDGASTDDRSSNSVLKSDSQQWDSSIPARARRLWRRRGYRIGMVLVGVIGLIATTVVVVAVVQDDQLPAAEDIVGVRLESVGYSANYDLAFPDEKADLAKQYVDYVDRIDESFDYRNYERMLTEEMKAGAFAVDLLMIRIELEGIIDSPVTITDIRVEDLRRVAVPDNTLVRVDLGGQDQPIPVRFSLDQFAPVAKEDPPIAGRPNKDFRDARHISLQKGDTQMLRLEFYTITTAATFHVAIDVESGGKTFTSEIYLTSEGHPFRVAPSLCPEQPKALLIGADQTEVDRLRSVKYGSALSFEPRGSQTSFSAVDTKDVCFIRDIRLGLA